MLGLAEVRQDGPQPRRIDVRRLIHIDNRVHIAELLQRVFKIKLRRQSQGPSQPHNRRPVLLAGTNRHLQLFHAGNIIYCPLQ
jgi:hypothetical protein